ncbi:MAG: hypothetical protein M1343_10105 [Chloroflexi bacterium]|nr:hypothetical protein [Chloroflexota bacterium]
MQIGEHFFWAVKLVVETRTSVHQWDKTITENVLCSFLGLVLADDLQGGVRAKGWQGKEW